MNEWLLDKCNREGDFKVATHFPDGRWSKHVSVMEIWHDLDNQRWRLERANNRTPTECELIIDFDASDDDTISNRDDAFFLYHKAKTIINTGRIGRYHLKNIKHYFSGSKGYHVHCIIPEFSLMTRQQREKEREKILRLLNADLAKKSEGSMIALEGMPHWKTGKKKTFIGGDKNG